MLSFLIFISGCVNLPKDLQDCEKDSDCTIVDSFLITKKLCNQDSINIKYKGWYLDEINKRDPYKGGDINCSPSPPTKTVCLENKCYLELIK